MKPRNGTIVFACIFLLVGCIQAPEIVSPIVSADAADAGFDAQDVHAEAFRTERDTARDRDAKDTADVARDDGEDVADNDMTDATDACTDAVWFLDQDGDGYGLMTNSKRSCGPPTDGNYSREPGDCADTNALRHPGADEQCDETDWDCDGDPKNGVTTTYFADIDGDAFGDPTNTQEACRLPDGYVENSDDCDDNNPAIHPNATEVCDHVDNNCNGVVDEGAPRYTYYADTDGDGSGDPLTTVRDCAPPNGYVANSDDCDDSEPTVHPGGVEVGYDAQGGLVNHCDDGLDNDCQNGIDQSDVACADRDADGIPNGADAIYTTDNDGDGNGDMICVKAALTMPSAWQPHAAIYHGEAPSGWGSFSAPLPSGQVDTYDPATGAYCRAFLGAPTGAYRYRYVSEKSAQNPSTAVNVSDCTDWQAWEPLTCQSSVVQMFGNMDPFCYQWLGSNTCGIIGMIIRVDWDASSGTLSP